MKTIAIKTKKTSQGGPRGSDPKVNPYLVVYNKNNQGWTAYGRFKSQEEASKQAKGLADAAERKGFKVMGRFRD